MTVPLRDDWHFRIVRIKPMEYLLGSESQKLVEDIFDELQAQGQLVFIKSHTPFSFPVFVV